MNVLYLTNSKVLDIDLIPAFINSFGDQVQIKTERFDLDYIKAEKIEFIVSDRAQFLIKKEIIDFLPQRIVNLHPSFLPWGRGYHPNYWSVKEGFPHGVSLHFIDEDIDTGPLIAQTRCFYSQQDSLKDTYNRLRYLMVDLFKSCWPELRIGKLIGVEQDPSVGCLHYKKDFEGHFEQLKDGWDTLIRDIRFCPAAQK